jgi:hypothetical protein
MHLNFFPCSLVGGVVARLQATCSFSSSLGCDESDVKRYDAIVTLLSFRSLMGTSYSLANSMLSTRS